MDMIIVRSDWDLAQIGKLAPECLAGQTSEKMAVTMKNVNLSASGIEMFTNNSGYVYKEQIVKLVLPPQLDVPLIPMPINIK